VRYQRTPVASSVKKAATVASGSPAYLESTHHVFVLLACFRYCASRRKWVRHDVTQMLGSPEGHGVGADAELPPGPGKILGDQPVRRDNNNNNNNNKSNLTTVMQEKVKNRPVGFASRVSLVLAMPGTPGRRRLGYLARVAVVRGVEEPRPHLEPGRPVPGHASRLRRPETVGHGALFETLPKPRNHLVVLVNVKYRSWQF
jgi:hypothetical protein